MSGTLRGGADEAHRDRARRPSRRVQGVVADDIGQALVRQDIRRGLLIYDDGTEQNYMLFLVDWLLAVRLVRYALDVVIVLGYTRAAVSQRLAS